MVVSEDGLPCQSTKTLDQIRIEDYSCVILPGMVNIGPTLQDEKLISFLRGLNEQDILIVAISSAPLLLAKAGLLNDTKFTGGIWQNFFDYLNFFHVRISNRKFLSKINKSLRLSVLHIKSLQEK